MTKPLVTNGKTTHLTKLPLLDNGINESISKGQLQNKKVRNRMMIIIPLIMGCFIVGGIIGLYFQPPGLKLIFNITGLSPGGGTNNPIATAVTGTHTEKNSKSRINKNNVTALGRLIPLNDIITVAGPYGAGDARIESINIEEGDLVTSGQIIATLDNRQQLVSAIDNAKSKVEVRIAELAQTTANIQASFLEAKANYQRALAKRNLADSEYKRGNKLRNSRQISQAELERFEATFHEMQGELDKAKASLTLYDGIEKGKQPDIILSQSNLDNALADLKRAETNLAMAEVIAPVDGRILSINTRIGERPGALGIATLGNTDRMEAELEVYQADIQKVRTGQKVLISASALGDDSLVGKVSRVGLEVKRQQLIEDDPAANTDARIVLVRVSLDSASSLKAAAFTGLQVEGQIEKADLQ